MGMNAMDNVFGMGRPMMGMMGGDPTGSLNQMPMDPGASLLMPNTSMGLMVPPGSSTTANLGLNPGSLPGFHQLLNVNGEVGQSVMPASQPDNLI